MYSIAAQFWSQISHIWNKSLMDCFQCCKSSNQLQLWSGFEMNSETLPGSHQWTDPMVVVRWCNTPKQLCLISILEIIWLFFVSRSQLDFGKREAMEVLFLAVWNFSTSHFDKLLQSTWCTGYLSSLCNYVTFLESPQMLWSMWISKSLYACVCVYVCVCLCVCVLIS